MQYLVLDVGGSAIKYALSDANYNFSERGSLANGNWSNSEEFIEAIGGLFDPVADKVTGIAISTCGELDPKSGLMYTGGYLSFNAGMNVIDVVEARCGRRTTVENDANCALLAEFHDGALSDCTNAVAIVIGTGVGGAVLINKAIYHGSHFYSGNASPMMVRIEGHYVWDNAFATQNGVRGLTEVFAEAKGLPAGSVDGRAFFAALADGDQAAAEILDAFSGRLAGMIFNLHCVLDVDAFAIGGGISVQPVLLETVLAKVDAIYAGTRWPLPKPAVRVCRHFNDANLRGALYHHLHTAPL